MRLFGRTVFVALVVCLFLLPSRSQAAPILSGPIGPGTYDFSGTFTVDNHVEFFPFELTATSAITADIGSISCPTPSLTPGDDCGFFPILTLFEGTAHSIAGFVRQLTFADPATTSIDWLTLGPGFYLLAITMYENYFDTGTGEFSYASVPGFTDLEVIFGGPIPGCEGFVQPVTASDTECRSGVFAGSLTLLQDVPEPGTLALLALGTAAVVRRRRSRAGKNARQP